MGRTDCDIFKSAGGWKERGKALLKVLGFVVLVAGIGVPATNAVRHISMGGSFEARGAAGEWLMILICLLATAIMARLSGAKFGTFGLGGKNRRRNFLIGLAAGIGLLAVQLGAMFALGGFSFGTSNGGIRSLLAPAVLYAALFAGVGIFEETAFRGFVLVQLSRAISFWPAAILLCVLFGAVHLGNDNENIFGAVAAGLFGVVFAYSFRATGSLWLAIGLHTGWDYAESFIFGVPDSGMTLDGRVLHPAFHGPDWLTGGSVGPEGSILILGPLLAILLIGWALRPRRITVIS